MYKGLKGLTLSLSLHVWFMWCFPIGWPWMLELVSECYNWPWLLCRAWALDFTIKVPASATSLASATQAKNAIEHMDHGDANRWQFLCAFHAGLRLLRGQWDCATRMTHFVGHQSVMANDGVTTGKLTVCELENSHRNSGFTHEKWVDFP